MHLPRPLAGVAVAAVVATTAAFAPAPTVRGDGRALAVPDGHELTHHWYESHDGVRLHAGVYLPADRAEEEQHPVVLSVTPYTSPNGGSLGLGFTNHDLPVRFPEVFEHPAFVEGRYAFVAADVRGFGGSGGCYEYYDRDEALDMDTHVEWAASRDWSSGRVGLWGKSYDAAQEVLALATPTRACPQPSSRRRGCRATPRCGSTGSTTPPAATPPPRCTSPTTCSRPSRSAPRPPRTTHRLGVYLNAGEDGWYSPGVSGQPVAVDLTLDLPLIATARTDFIRGGSSNFSEPFPITLDQATITGSEVAGGVPPAQRP